MGKTSNVPVYNTVTMVILFGSQNVGALLRRTNIWDLPSFHPPLLLAYSKSLKNFLHCVLRSACCCEIKISDRLVWVIQGLGHSNKKCKMWGSVASAVLQTPFALFCEVPVGQHLTLELAQQKLLWSLVHTRLVHWNSWTPLLCY